MLMHVGASVVGDVGLRAERGRRQINRWYCEVISLCLNVLAKLK